MTNKLLRKPNVIFVFSKEGSDTSTKYGGFAKRLQKNGALQDVTITTVALENLVFVIREDKSAVVYDPVAKIFIGDADFVYFKSWGKLKSEACALANYLFGRGVPFMDSAVLYADDSKLSTAFKLWAKDLPVPATIYSRKYENVLNFDEIESLIGHKFVAKDINGEKGQNNYYVTADEFQQIAKANPDIQFICQRLIPNEGDWRIGVYGGRASFAILRKGKRGSHLNNISAGGEGKYFKIEQIDKKLISISEFAAEASQLEIAGVDIIQDKITSRFYLLEVNQGSQIVTGSFVNENIKSFGSALENIVAKRHAKPRKKTLTTIGRRSRVSLPELGVVEAVAKIDTGAYSSSIHVENICLVNDKNGEKVLHYEIYPRDGYNTQDNKRQILKTHDYFVQKVRSSNGSTQDRYTIRTKMVIGGKKFRTTVTLSDRSDMGYPVLVGRRMIRSRFIVNVELNENNKEQWNY